ncbi:MAG: class I SAM-dependent methyltransferase [Solirubrobacterales bacterium]
MSEPIDRPGEEWAIDAARVEGYLASADELPHRAEGEGVLLELLPARARRVLDIGTGDGRLLALVRAARPGVEGVGLDFSPLMLARARARFAGDAAVDLVEHDLGEPLPELGRFDAVVSSFVIHHLDDARKRELYGEAFALLEPGGVFANFEHVASPTESLHLAFLAAIDEPPENEDPSDRTVAVETQLGWLREAGFADVECYWKWREMALLAGVRPPPPAPDQPPARGSLWSPGDHKEPRPRKAAEFPSRGSLWTQSVHKEPRDGLGLSRVPRTHFHHRPLRTRFHPHSERKCVLGRGASSL